MNICLRKPLLLLSGKIRKTSECVADSNIYYYFANLSIPSLRQASYYSYSIDHDSDSDPESDKDPEDDTDPEDDRDPLPQWLPVVFAIAAAVGVGAVGMAS